MKKIPLVAGMMLLLLAGLSSWAQLPSGNRSLEELLNKNKPKDVLPTQETLNLWHSMISSFARNDEKNALLDAERLMTQRGLLTPQQVEATSLLVQLGNLEPGGTP